MNLLLDTHTLLWSLMGENLSQTAQAAFLNPDNILFFSAASYWEICIKVAVGKLILADNWVKVFDREMGTNSTRWLPIEKTHCQKILELPFLHHDPFDRLLVAQALCEDLTILTADKNIKAYDVSSLW